MRQWGIKPKALCDKHLRGEHSEHHALKTIIEKGQSITGYLENNLLAPKTLNRRHDALAKEMVKRGMNHKSPLEPVDLSKLTKIEQQHKINVESSTASLLIRCLECRKRIAEGYAD